MPKGKHSNHFRGHRPLTELVEIICLVCGKIRKYRMSELRVRGIIKYCSCQCRDKARTKRGTYIEMICRYCGKNFNKRKDQVKENNFCSQTCTSKFKKGKKLSPEKIEKTKQAMARPEVREKLRRLNSRKRSPLSEEHKRNLQESRGPWTDEQKARVSQKLCGKMPANMQGKMPFSNIKHGYYDINGKTLFFRSKWEANYALYLDFLVLQKEIDSWEYEPDVFVFHKIKFGTRSYRPDFKIKQNGNTEYHEVKGHMDSKSKTKLNRMRIYYPDVVLKIIDIKAYREIQKWGKLIKFY